MVGVTYPLALLLLLPALALALWPRAAGAALPAGLPGDWARVVEPALRAIAAGGDQDTRPGRVGRLPLAIWCLLVVALAGPGIESGTRQAFGNLAGRVIVLDLGSSSDMAAQRVAAGRLLDRSPEVPTAVVAATSDAFDVMPLTRDRRQIERYLQVLDPGMMPVGGRALALAFGHAETILVRAGIVAGQVVLVTGGAPPASAAPGVPARTASPWLRAVVVVGPGAQRSRAAWQAYAESEAARLSEGEQLSAVTDDLARAVAQASREAGDRARLDLTPWLIAVAAALWLGLFRRRVER